MMNLQEMARHAYGYGHWEAPYWFLGLEEGKGRNESLDNSERLRAWSKLQEDGLSDLVDFHREIGEDSWHRKLQPTWRPLILLLLSALGRPIENSDLLKYQRESWGTKKGQTAVIELSGIAARSLNKKVERNLFLNERISELRGKIERHKPKLLVMYGITNKKQWEMIANSRLERDGIVRVQETLVLFAPHPNCRGRRNDDWIALGEKIGTALPKM